MVGELEQGGSSLFGFTKTVWQKKDGKGTEREGLKAFRRPAHLRDSFCS